MSCISEIVKRLRESRLEETTFDYDGSEYENRYGNYTRNHRPISKEEYHKARKSLLSQDDEENSIMKDLNIPHKKLAMKIEEFNNFIDNLEYDKSYEVTRETRGHLERIDPYSEDDRVSQIMDDTNLSESDSEKINDIIIEYTSTDSYTEFSDSDRELLDTFLEESPIYAPPPVYRGMGFREKLGGTTIDIYNQFKEMREGSVMTFEDYTSFSSNPDVSVEFAHSHGDHQVYLVNTKNLTGVSIDHLSSITYEEDELLYKSDVRMKVLGKSISDDGTVVYLHVEELSLDEDVLDDNDIIEIPLCGSMYIEGK